MLQNNNNKQQINRQLNKDEKLYYQQKRKIEQDKILKITKNFKLFQVDVDDIKNIRLIDGRPGVSIFCHRYSKQDNLDFIDYPDKCLKTIESIMPIFKFLNIYCSSIRPFGNNNKFARMIMFLQR